MITSSGKQSDKEVETFCAYLMQMCMSINCHRGIAEVKISLPSLLYNCSVVGQAKCDIDKQ